MKILIVLFCIVLVSGFLIGFNIYNNIPQEIGDSCRLSDTCEEEQYNYKCIDGNYIFYLKEIPDIKEIKCAVTNNG